MVDVPATLAARVRVLGSGRSNKNDANGGYSIAVAALHAPRLERTRTFSKKVDAERWLRHQSSARDRGAWVDPRSGRTTFGVYAKRWQAAQVHRPQTVARVDSNLRCHVYPFFEDRPLTSIGATEIQVWVRGLSSTLAPASVEVCYRYVSAMFRAAVRDRLIDSSPCDRIRLPKKERRVIVPPEVEHVEALVAALPDRYQALVVFAAGTGLRQGEVFGLKLGRVEFLRHSVEVSSQLVDGLPAPLKTDASYRTVPLSEHLRQFPVGVGVLVFTNEPGSRSFPGDTVDLRQLPRPAFTRQDPPHLI